MSFKKTLSQKKTYIPAFLGLIVLALVFGIFLLLKQRQAEVNSSSLTQEELTKLVKPSVVRISQHISGLYNIPPFDLNPTTGEISFLANQTNENQQVDEYLTGTGFIINPDGYILTNSHVVSQETIKFFLLGQTLDQVWQVKTKDNSALQNREWPASLAKKLFQSLKERSTFNLQNDLAVLNPGSTKEGIADLTQNGFPAKIINVNDNFLFNEKDVALIKINQSQLPAVALGDSSNVGIGQKIFILGFPATAEFNQRSPLESTFTQGVISAIKFSENKDFKVFQTDAKISQGSSGGPLFNDQGQVVGVVTFQTGQNLRQAGDNFAFAVPIQIAQTVLEQQNIQNIASDYPLHFSKGLKLLHARQCEEAQKEFDLAGKTNFLFATEKYLDPYIQQCNQLLTAKLSVDSWLAKLLQAFQSLGWFVWFVIVGRIVLILAAIWALWKLVERIRKDESEITELETELKQEKQKTNQVSDVDNYQTSPLPLPEAGIYALGRQPQLPHPHILDYIQEARLIGLKDELILQDLKLAGWDEQEILKALKS